MSTNEFNRWHDSVYVCALREASEAFAMGEGLEAFAVANVTDDEGVVLATSKWLDARADRIERGGAAMIEATERAWWWELTGGGYRFQPGEPWRSESPNGVAREGVTGPTGFRQWGGYPLFRDTRWTPPRPAYKVGDVIETVEDLDRLPPGTGVVDYREGIVRKRYSQRWTYANLSGESYGSESMMRRAPITVIYLPKVGGDE